MCDICSGQVQTTTSVGSIRTLPLFQLQSLVNPHQRCGYSDSPFARIYFFHTAGSRNGFEGMEAVCRLMKKQKTISKRHFFLMEKYIEDLRQDEKHVPDLLESIIQLPGPVKDELRQKLSKIDQFGSKIPKMRISKFWIPEFQSFPAGGQHNLLAQ